MPRILVVEDDLDLLELTAAILGQAHHVVCESTTAPALRRIASEHFDLLVTDLNIEGAGDGLLLAGAMRSLQPQARTVLITGFPDFTRAVAAMQATLDLMLIKPVDVDTIRNLPQHIASAPPLHPVTGNVSLWLLLERHRTDILSDWLQQVERDEDLKQVPLTPSERLDHMDLIVNDIAGGGAGPTAHELGGGHAAAHGQMRHVQNYRPEWIAKEISLLRRAIFAWVLRELLSVDLSTLTPQIFELNAALDTELLRSLRSFGLLAA
ncbi:MAG: response regulator [Terriglobales bacterium]